MGGLYFIVLTGPPLGPPLAWGFLSKARPGGALLLIKGPKQNNLP